MKLRALLAAGVVCLACAGPAAATGPVFVVVPNAQPAAAAVSPRAQLRSDRKTLGRVRAARRRALRHFTRAHQRFLSASVLSDRLAAEQQAAELQAQAAADAARASRLREQIGQLEEELQPVPLAWVPPLAPTATPSPDIGLTAVSIADEYLGVPYRWGGAGPLTGFDCSGLTMYVYAQLGISLPHYAAAQWNELPHVDPAQLAPGDLVFFEPEADGPGHVGIYAGGDVFIEAPHTGEVVKLASLSEEAAELGFVGAARPAELIPALPGL
jgi:cell wall-associated NlpC family hydrolase